MKRRIIKIILCLFWTAAFVVLFFYLWLSNVWRFSANGNYYEELSAKINASKPVPDSLANLYLQVYKTEKGNSLTEELFLKYLKALVNGNYRKDETHNCLCDEIIYTIPIIKGDENRMYWPTGFETFKMGFGIEAKTGDEACFHYFLRNEYAVLSREVRNYPYSFVGKPIDDLTKEEYLEFLVIKKAPTFFNKYRNPEAFMKRKKVLEKLLQ